MGSDGMEKYKYADTAKINVKPDGSVVCSLYVNDSKEKKEYFKNAARMKKAAGSNGNSKKKRTVTVSKSTKAKHKDKLKVESYLQANSWEYVLRVPITSVDHQTTWTKFKQRYNYKHKDHPLQYVMVKGDGELYGVISNAPVEGENIPLVNVEHSVVSAYDKSVIKQLTGLSLQYKYKGKEHSYTSSNGLKEKTFEFVNLGGIEYFALPDDALVTQMQASLVFNGGTVEENLAAARRFIKEKRVDRVEKESEKKAMRNFLESGFNKQYPELKNNIDMVIFDKGYIENPEKIKLNYRVEDGFEIVTACYNGYEILEQVKAVGKKRKRHAYTYPHTQYNFPYVYFIVSLENGMVYYVGQTGEPLKRYCQHFGIYKFKTDQTNNSEFYQYITETFPADKWQEEFNKYTMLFIPLLKYEIDGKIVKYLPRFRTSKVEIEKAEARFQNLILQLEEKGRCQVFRKDGKPLFHQGTSFANYNSRLNQYKEKYGTEKDPVKMCFKMAIDRNKKYGEHFATINEVVQLQRVTELADMEMQPKEVQGFLKEYLGKRYKREDEILGMSIVSSAIMRYGSGVNVDDEEKELVENIMHWSWQNNKLECGEVGQQIGRGTWSEDGKTVTRSFCYAVNGCIGKMQPAEYPCFNGKECKCYDLVQEPTVFSDEPEQP